MIHPEEIRKFLKRNGLTKWFLAKRLDCSAQTVSRMLRGKASDKMIRKFRDVCEEYEEFVFRSKLRKLRRAK